MDSAALDRRFDALAESMGVQPVDVRCLAYGVVNSMRQDGADKAFLEAGEEGRSKLLKAHIVRANEKIQLFREACCSRPEVGKAFAQEVLELKKSR